MIPVESIDSPTIDLPKIVCFINAFQINKLDDGFDIAGESNDLPTSLKKHVIRTGIQKSCYTSKTRLYLRIIRQLGTLKEKSVHYIQLEGNLFRWSENGTFNSYLYREETIECTRVLEETIMVDVF